MQLLCRRPVTNINVLSNYEYDVLKLTYWGSKENGVMLHYQVHVLKSQLDCFYLYFPVA